MPLNQQETTLTLWSLIESLEQPASRKQYMHHEMRLTERYTRWYHIRRLRLENPYWSTIWGACQAVRVPAGRLFPIKLSWGNYHPPLKWPDEALTHRRSGKRAFVVINTYSMYLYRKVGPTYSTVCTCYELQPWREYMCRNWPICTQNCWGGIYFNQGQWFKTY